MKTSSKVAMVAGLGAAAYIGGFAIPFIIGSTPENSEPTSCEKLGQVKTLADLVQSKTSGIILDTNLQVTDWKRQTTVSDPAIVTQNPSDGKWIGLDSDQVKKIIADKTYTPFHSAQLTCRYDEWKKAWLSTHFEKGYLAPSEILSVQLNGHVLRMGRAFGR